MEGPADLAESGRNFLEQIGNDPVGLLTAGVLAVAIFMQQFHFGGKTPVPSQVRRRGLYLNQPSRTSQSFWRGNRRRIVQDYQEEEEEGFGDTFTNNLVSAASNAVKTIKTIRGKMGLLVC